jgi:dolichyl-phosphate-mannose-protein mannosyltransferase
MQRSNQSTSTSASTALRRTLRSDIDSDEEDLADPRPWETRAPLKSYGSLREKVDLPLFDDMETRRRYGEKEDVAALNEEMELLDDQGKWAKGHGAGPGAGGRRGLQPRQRIGGWVSRKLGPC